MARTKGKPRQLPQAPVPKYERAPRTHVAATTARRRQIWHQQAIRRWEERKATAQQTGRRFNELQPVMPPAHPGGQGSKNSLFITQVSCNHGANRCILVEALRQIRFYQRTQSLILPQSRFNRLVREIQLTSPGAQIFVGKPQP